MSEAIIIELCKLETEAVRRVMQRMAREQLGEAFEESNDDESRRC